MTPEQKEKYLRNPGACPHCGSNDLEGESINLDDNIAWQTVGCTKCNQQWNDIYTLTDVEEA